jgi:hypothetical protein
MSDTVSATPVPFPDRLLERGVEDGIEWCIITAPFWGTVNGYALLPEGHPWRELDLQSSDYDKGPDVHGGITYGPSDGWVGFDTAHSGDVWPGSDMPTYGPSDYDRTWTVDLVADEARNLARQIAAAVSA